VRTSGFRKACFHKPVYTADSVYTSQLFNHGESYTRGSRQFARNNGSDAGSTSVNRMSSGEFVIAAMKMPTIRYEKTSWQRKFIVEIDSLRLFDKDGIIERRKVSRYFYLYISFSCFRGFSLSSKSHYSDFNLSLYWNPKKISTLFIYFDEKSLEELKCF